MLGYRTGLGFDLHRVKKSSKPLVLGGHRINCGLSLEAVSDGDLVLHAVADAVCGAACLGDIGDYFKPSAKKSKNINSKKIVEFILNKIKGSFEVANIDITLIAQKPPLVEHKKAITAALKKIFKTSQINLKLKSKEATRALGGTGALSCFAVVLLKEIKK